MDQALRVGLGILTVEVLLEYLGDGPAVERGADDASLHLVAVLCPKELDLFLPLDPFEDYLEVKIMGERDNAAGDGAVFSVRSQLADERFVDLEAANRETAQTVER